ncbi:MAG: prephenate dehydratase, partial [Chloroflexota bacterium]|nr:prephenate dehydratase [Chloroflexota bacterium]
MSKKIAYLGPPGTFAEEAALLYDKTAQLMPFPSVRAVANAVALAVSEVEEGVVPIENSLEGSVTDTLDLLIHESGVMINREIVLPIKHNLLARPGTGVNDIKVLYSHPQPLGQCRSFVDLHFPKVSVVAALSTADAVEEMMLSDKPAAAIGTARAAEIYGAAILATGIQDNVSNETRFVILAKDDHPQTGNDKTSLCFTFSDDHPGVLVETLQVFSQRGINLTKVESRPSKQVLGKYIFLIDLQGHRDDAIITEAFDEVRARTSQL